MLAKLNIPQGLSYCSFHDNLSTRLSQSEVASLQVLGKEFFLLVDRITRYLLHECPEDHHMLDITQDDFMWELQVFGNRFLRANCESPLKLRNFCKVVLMKLEDETFAGDFCKETYRAYQSYFFIEPSQTAYLN